MMIDRSRVRGSNVLKILTNSNLRKLCQSQESRLKSQESQDCYKSQDSRVKTQQSDRSAVAAVTVSR